MAGWKKSIGKSLKFDRTAAIGLLLLIISFTMGALLRKSATITTQYLRQATCDTYVRGLCIPTAYFSMPLGGFGWLVINLTSFLVSVALFVLGVVLVRK